MSLRIYNTLSRALEEFSPIESGHVRMYVCGMTIYDLCHIGHARMAMAFDVVQRWLKISGLRVTYVRNITDIDDKIIKRALERNITIRALTDEMIEVMRADIARLGIEPPTLEPRATEYVPQMLALIRRLEAKGLAYQAPSGDVNFAVRKFPGYGKLSGKSLDDLRAGERVAVQDDKGDPLDFVLWKAAKESEPDDAKWDGTGGSGSGSGSGTGDPAGVEAGSYDYGRGRPGWHIECSAMCSETLGETFDIHGGGVDLQFPHHENEIAQSEGATGKPLARFWMHNGMVQMDNEKMSKSLGNFFTIREVLARYKQPETVRFFLVRAHYRTDLNYSDVHLDDAENALKRLYTALSLVEPVIQPADAAIDWSNPFAARFKAAMDDDFGTPGAVSVLFELATEVNKTRSAELAGLLKALGATLGLLQMKPSDFLQSRITANPGNAAATGVTANIVSNSLSSLQIDDLIHQRATAKAAKNFPEADRIRQDLLGQGIVLKDSPTGTTWEAK